MLRSSEHLANPWGEAYLLCMTRASSRLSASDWLAAGMDALSESGPEALKAEPLAVRLGVSKGSFYWHFRDVPAFHAALLTAWQTETIAQIDDQAGDGSTPVAHLRSLTQAFAAPDAAEPAIRSWAQSDDGARMAVDAVDDTRLERLQSLLSDTGIDNPEMARILYSAAVGMTTLGNASPGDHLSAIGSMVDLVLALR
ncbi:MAG: TetR/AcrR family transcriptional regulator [Pseudomonadota bacterium]